MLLTAICMLSSAIARPPITFQSNQVIFSCVDLFLLIRVGIDAFCHHRLHPARTSGGVHVRPFELGKVFHILVARSSVTVCWVRSV
jgi:hypothetical protein